MLVRFTAFGAPKPAVFALSRARIGAGSRSAAAIHRANYVHFDLIDLVVPFASSRSPIAVGVGVLAEYLALVVHPSFDLRKRIGTAMWRRLHYLSFVAFVLVTIHAIAAGTDHATGWYVALLLVVVRVLTSRRAGASC